MWRLTLLYAILFSIIVLWFDFSFSVLLTLLYVILFSICLSILLLLTLLILCRFRGFISLYVFDFISFSFLSSGSLSKLNSLLFLPFLSIIEIGFSLVISFLPLLMTFSFKYSSSNPATQG